MASLRRTHALRGGLTIGSLGLVGLAVIIVEAVLARSQPRTPDPDFTVQGRLVHPQDGARPGTDPRDVLTLAVLGDSTVVGVGVTEAEDSLPMQVARRVADATGNAVRVSSFGSTGDEAAEIEQRLVDVDAEPRPDVLVIVAGANDVTAMTPPRRFVRDTDELLRHARERFPGTRLVLAGIPRFADTPVLAQPLRMVVDRYSRVLQRRQAIVAAGHDGVRYVDIARRASPRFLGRPDAYSGDGFHPSRVGYGFWADAIAEDVEAAASAASRSAAGLENSRS